MAPPHRDRQKAWRPPENQEIQVPEWTYASSGDGYDSDLELSEGDEAIAVGRKVIGEGGQGAVRLLVDGSKVVKRGLWNYWGLPVTLLNFAKQEVRYYNDVYPGQVALFISEQDSHDYRLVMPNWGSDAFAFLIEAPEKPSDLAVYEVFLAILRELKRIHGLGWVHRDFKLGNVLIQQCNGRYEVRIIDGAFAAKVGETFSPYEADPERGRTRGDPGLAEEFAVDWNIKPASVSNDIHCLGLFGGAFFEHRGLLDGNLGTLIKAARNGAGGRYPALDEFIAEFEARVKKAREKELAPILVRLKPDHGEDERNQLISAIASDDKRCQAFLAAKQYLNWNESHASLGALSFLSHLSHGRAGRNDALAYLRQVAVGESVDLAKATKAFLTGGVSRSGHQYQSTTSAKTHSRLRFFAQTSWVVEEKASWKSAAHGTGANVALGCLVALAALSVAALIVASHGVALPLVGHLLLGLSKAMTLPETIAVLASPAALGVAAKTAAASTAPRFAQG